MPHAQFTSGQKIIQPDKLAPIASVDVSGVLTALRSTRVDVAISGVYRVAHIDVAFWALHLPLRSVSEPDAPLRQPPAQTPQRL